MDARARRDFSRRGPLISASQPTVSKGASEVCVAICVATYKRPQGLKGLLESLSRLVFEKLPVPHIEIVVVDNDVSRSAAGVCRAYERLSPWRIKYFVEAKRGIAAARNRTVKEARDMCGWLAFIDDDEEADPRWLDELLAVQKITGADILTGPILTKFANKPPAWVVKGGFFNRERYASGTMMKYVRTGNLLMSASVFEGISFDTRLSFTGGEDTLMSMEAYQAGYRMAWADEAVVHEWVPPLRVTEQWLIQRSYRIGNTQSICALLMRRSIWTLLGRFARAIRDISLGTVGIIPATMFGKDRVVACKLKIARGAGMLMGLVGYWYEEYGDERNRKAVDVIRGNDVNNC